MPVTAALFDPSCLASHIPDFPNPPHSTVLAATCVVATKSVLGPSEFSPRYTNEFDEESPGTENSNVLLFNVLSKMKRGFDKAGVALAGPQRTGEHYLRQIDIRRLIDSGALAGKKLKAAASSLRFGDTGFVTYSRMFPLHRLSTLKTR